VSVGRDETNSVAIDDLAASRRHFTIRASGDRFQLTDLSSRNGTFVNGVPVRQRLLEDNDEIRVGDSVFRFRRSAPAPADPQPVSLGVERTSGSSTLLRSGDSIYLNKRRLDETLPVTDRRVRGVQVLLGISQAVQGAQTLEALARQMLELLFEAVPAENGALALSTSGEEFEAAFTWQREAGSGRPVQVPPQVSGQVFENRMAVLAETSGAPPTKFIAVPLICFDRVEGLIYLETSDPAGSFDNGHLELVAAVGAIAGLAVHNLLRLENLRTENRRLEAEIRIEHDMVGDSRPMQDIHRFIGRVAATDSTVLIGGESGTGKELVARAIHRNSPRASKTFVAINCAALTETLLEDEMFGHERGAFTGAVNAKKGKFEVADGGTLFLDEIGELAPPLQAKLLRVIQQREFERVGGTKPIRVDVRILAASNRDLEAAVRANQFRQDLYFRLNVISVTMPALRDRREDIPALAAYFARKCAERLKRRPRDLSDKIRACLMKYDWPGNVRELENAIERAVVLGSAEQLLPEDLPEAVLESEFASPSGSAGSPGSYQEAVVEAKRRVVRDALERANGVYTEAARLLDIHPNYLHRLVRSLNLR
jgi:Nif-specific regulatory protein